MQKDFILFFDKLENDPTLRRNFERSKSLEKAFEIAKPYLNNCNFEEFQKCLLIVDSTLSNNLTKLRETELELIAGGMGFREVVDYFGNSKRVAALALTSLLTAGGISSSVSAMPANEPPIIQQVNQQEHQAENLEANQQVNQLAIWDGTVDTTWCNDDNKNAQNFEITTAAQLAGLAKLVNDGKDFSNQTITLANDLDMNGRIWTPIGHKDRPFKGIFNGNNKTISSLATNEEQDRQGLFGNNQGIIKNIGIINSEIKGKTYVGGVVGYNNGKIENSYNTGNVKGESQVGGVVGYSYEGIMKNIYNTGNVEVNSKYAGGVIGFNYDGTMENSYNTGAVKGTQHVGGVAGYVDRGTTKKIYNMGNVEGMQDVGGVAGYNKGKIENSYNKGNVKGESRVGGVVGYNNYNDIITIENSYNTGAVKGAQHVGGVAGYNRATIENSYNTGNVKGESQVGGIVGSLEINGKINKSYNAGAIKGQSYAGGIVGSSFGVIESSYYCNDNGKITIKDGSKPIEAGKGITSDEMKTQEFATTLGAAFMKWQNNNYPVLREIIFNDRGPQKDINQDYKNTVLKFTQDSRQLLQLQNNAQQINIEDLNQ